MLFNSFGFLLFFPCVFLIYYALPFRFRKFLLLLSSWYFYMCWKPEFIVLILFSTAVDYFCGLGIGRWRQRRAIFLAVSLVMNLGLLFFFKYLNFFGQTLTAVCQAVAIPFSAPVLDIVLPVGISFYTFQTLSYTIDVYRGKLAPERDFVTFALFVSYFHQLVAGPIERAENLLPQLKEEHPFSYDNAVSGLKLMAWGFFKKCVAAAYLAMWVDPVYGNVTAYSGGALVVATCAFALQIYCDFGGYSDIARGCARMMGVELMVNFRSPYFFSRSIGEYWKRNHISLSEWFHQYVYIPLGGNRKGRLKKYCFLTVTFFLSGLWHGAAWTFVIWGGLHGFFLCVETLLSRTGKRVPHPLGTVWTFCLTAAAWIFFRAGSMTDAIYVMRHLLDGVGSPLAYAKAAYQHTPSYQRLEQNDYPWDYRDMPESVEIAVFGSSHAVYGFYAFTEDHESAFSFALPSQTPQYDWMLMRQYQDRLAQDALVVLTISYLSPFWTDTPEQFQEKQDRYYSILMPWNLVDVDLSKWVLERISPLLTTAPEEVMAAFREERPEEPLPDPYWEYANGGCLDAAKAAEEAQITYQRHQTYLEPVFPDTNPVMWDALENMLSLCDERGWKPVLVVPPYSAPYNDCFSQEFFSTFSRLLEELSDEFQVPILDYSRDPQFSGQLDLFRDPDHLNFAGSQRLEQRLEADLEALGIW